MSRNVPIDIFLLAQTRLNREVVRDWLRSMGVGAYRLPEEDAEGIISLAAKQCYMSFEPGLNPNIQKVRTDLKEYLDNILKSGHGSVLEHATFSFAINGVSRVFTGEMNRHRAGWSISERSMRFIRYSDIPWWLPRSISPDTDDSVKKAASREIFNSVFEYVEEAYKELGEIWAEELAPESKFASKKHITSMMRRIIPMGVATGGIWTGNVRALRHVLELRTSAAAEEEILEVFSRVAALMVKNYSLLFGDFVEEDGHWTPKFSKV